MSDSGIRTPMPAKSIPARLRTGRGASLRVALVVLAVCALLLGLLPIAVGVGNPNSLMWAVQFFTAVFWVWAAAGLLAWWRRPDNAMGALIFGGGLALYLAGLGNTGVVELVTVSAVFGTAPLAVTVHLLHAFPSGRVRGRLSMVTVVLGYVTSVALQLARVLLSPGAPEAFAIATMTQQALGIAVMVMTSIVLVQRLLRADRRHRRVLLPLFGYGTIAVLLLALAGPLARAFGLDASVGGSIQLVISAGIPIAFLLGVLLGGFTRTGELEPLSAWLGSTGATGAAVARALASTLGDESLRVVYWSEREATYVDEVGLPIDSERGDPDRGWSEIRVDDRLVGAISYDARMIADPAPVQRAGDVLAIAVDRERLTAQLMASNEALTQSRVRLIEAADRERTRIAQDLHDGIQVQLVLLALAAQTIANSPDASPRTGEASAELRRGIDEAAADLRRLVHNVLPSSLTERGLTAATEDLVDRLSIPATLDAEIDDTTISATTTHTAYFIVSEGLTNAVKHSGATSVRVRLRAEANRLMIDIRDNGVGGVSMSQGSGLRGLIDRVDVLGGKFAIDSPRDHGTRLMVELPCA
ncbi:sensor histidine kinase [Microbacterium pygmaeum]|uniref:histidine kinase n=1 Tax=Microbacterium pygmaeum TaxID=370764 RepID=A0A1G7YHR7_9MICO|nr:histidine kinase [Microbacterium pygmaeum]SDG96108.1 Histidine kinase [Microbacterium pygmaeum]